MNDIEFCSACGHAQAVHDPEKGCGHAACLCSTRYYDALFPSERCRECGHISIDHKSVLGCEHKSCSCRDVYADSARTPGLWIKSTEILKASGEKHSVGHLAVGIFREWQFDASSLRRSSRQIDSVKDRHELKWLNRIGPAFIPDKPIEIWKPEPPDFRLVLRDGSEVFVEHTDAVPIASSTHGAHNLEAQRAHMFKKKDWPVEPYSVRTHVQVDSILRAIKNKQDKATKWHWRPLYLLVLATGPMPAVPGGDYLELAAERLISISPFDAIVISDGDTAYGLRTVGSKK